MSIRSVLTVACCAAALLVPATAADAAARTYPNCKSLNAVYPHGVGRVGARDHVSSGTPVTTFKRSNSLYAANVKRDGDKDKVACEKR